MTDFDYIGFVTQKDGKAGKVSNFGKQFSRVLNTSRINLFCKSANTVFNREPKVVLCIVS